QKGTALLRSIRFVRVLVDGEEVLLFEREEFFLPRVLIKRELRFIDRLAFFWILHHPQKLFVARLSQLHFEQEPAAALDVALLELLFRFTGETIAKHVLLA